MPSSERTVREVEMGSEAARDNSRMKSWTSTISAVLLSVVFLASGIWKLTDLDGMAERIIQLLVPVSLSLPAAIAAAAGETLTGVLLLVPRFRRWGAWLAVLMLAAFMIYFAILYRRLLGADCSCFPWVERVVGPAFFAGDGIMLVLAVAAGWWAPKARGMRQAAIVLGCVCLIAGASYGLSSVLRKGADVPESAIVDGNPVRLRNGRVLLYFFDPECMHCYAVAQKMATFEWGKTRVIALPTTQQRYARNFLNDTGLRAGVSPDAAALRKAFIFKDPPFAAALERGRVSATFNSGQVELEDYYRNLKRLGFVSGIIPKEAR